jgi:hypothetical protein
VGIEAATAAPGAMPVIDWNRTSRNPMAFARRPVAAPVSAPQLPLETAFVVVRSTKATNEAIV